MFADRTNWNLTPNRLTDALAEHRSQGLPLFDLTVSNPTAAGFALGPAELSAAMSDPAAVSYDPDPRGLPATRSAITAYYAEVSVSLDPDRILVTTGTSEGYGFLFRLLCNPGDEVLIPSPGYPLFEFLADIHDVRLVRYPLFYDHGWQIDLHSLASAVTPRTRAIVIVHPNNPTGHFCSAGELAQLNALATKNALALVADEVFLDFPLEAQPAFSFAANTSVLTFTLSGLSKICGLPQMKLAWVAVTGPPAHVAGAAERLEVLADSYLSVSTPIQLATGRFLGNRSAFQPAAGERVRANLAELDRQLGRQVVCSRLRADAGWNAVLRVPAIRSDEELALELLHKKHVLLHPGHFYDFRSDGFLVVSLLTRQAEFKEGIARLISYLAG